MAIWLRLAVKTVSPRFSPTTKTLRIVQKPLELTHEQMVEMAKEILYAEKERVREVASSPPIKVNGY